MTLPAPIAWIFGLCFAGIVIGTYLHLKSTRAGTGPSPTGIAIQVTAIVVVLLLVSAVFVIAIVKSGLWPLVVLVVPFPAVAGVLAIAAVRNLRARRPP
jgi:hypothetical protein